MIEITLIFVFGVILVVLSVRHYWAVVIGSVFIGIASLACIAFVCIPQMMEALEAYERQNPHTLHAYAMILGSLGLIGAAYCFYDRYWKSSGSQDDGSQDAGPLRLGSSKE
jgi:hypothetical protein